MKHPPRATTFEIDGVKYEIVYPSLNFILCKDEKGNEVKISYSKFKEAKNETRGI